MGSIPSTSHGVPTDVSSNSRRNTGYPGSLSTDPRSSIPASNFTVTPQVNPVEQVTSPLAQQPLPPGWEVRTDRYGRPYFLDHVHKRTTFVDPRVPSGWEMQLDGHGRPYFIDHISKRTTWQDPRLLPGWEVQLDSSGRPYYIDHINKRTTYNEPRTLMDTQPLPQGWEMKIDHQGKPVYIDRVTKRTTYDRPIEENKSENATGEENKPQDITGEGDKSQEGEDGKSEENLPPPHGYTETASDDKSCIICLENERCVALIPCGHLCLCRQCCGSQTKCPICRTPIREFLRTFNV